MKSTDPTGLSVAAPGMPTEAEKKNDELNKELAEKKEKKEKKEPANTSSTGSGTTTTTTASEPVKPPVVPAYPSMPTDCLKYLGQESNNFDYTDPFAMNASNPKLTNWPLDTKNVSSEYGKRPEPTPGTGTFHSGIDLLAPNGSPVKATSNGTVTQIANHPKYGTVMVISMDNGLTTADMHLSSTAVGVGNKVTAGKQTGTTGTTGEWTTGGHDHFSVWNDSTKVTNFVAGDLMVTRDTINPRSVLPK